MSIPQSVNPGREAQMSSVTRVLMTVLVPFALAHFISYLYRTINAVVYPDLARDLGLQAGSIGLLTGSYLLAFAASQLPIGVALDRYGPRRVQVPLLAVAAAGALLFSQAQSLAQLTLARSMIGVGVAGSLMAAIKAGSLWLPQERLPLSTAVLLSVGGMGAMASTSPMQAVLTATGWRTAFVGLALATLLVGLLILMMVPEHPARQKTRLAEMAKAVGQLYRSWTFWRLALYSLLAHATYMAVQGLWLGAWLRDVAHLSRSASAGVLLAGTAAMVAGSLVFGWVIDYLRRFGVRPILVCGTGIGFFLLFQLLLVLENNVPPILAVIGFGFFGTSTTMNYAIVAQSVPSHLTGRVSTSFNLLVFLFAFLLQWGIGTAIGMWTPVDGMYPATAYRTVLTAVLCAQLPGFLLWLNFKPWERETARATGS